MAFEDSMPDRSGMPDMRLLPETERIPLIAPAHREPLSVLLLGIVLFCGLLALAWIKPPATTSAGASFTLTLDARQQTYLVELILYHTLQHDLPSWLNMPGSLAGISAETAGIWAQVSAAPGPARIRGFAAVDAAALYGVARQWPTARASLHQALARDPAHAAVYQQLLALYAEPFHPVVLSTDVSAVLAQLSTGPLIAARNAALSRNAHGEITALQFGATAGQRVLTVNIAVELLLTILLIVAAIVFFARGHRVAEDVGEAEHQQAPPVPWGIGTALLLISFTYLCAGVLGPLGAQLLRIHGDSPASMVVQVLSILVSAVIILGVFLLMLERKPWEWEVFGWRSTRWGPGYGILVLLMSLPFVLGLSYLSERLFGAHDSVNPLIPELLTARSPLLMVFLVLAAVVMAPLVEETLFRGILFRAANARLPFWIAALGSGLLFGAVHGELVALLPISLLGAVFAFLTRRTRSLLASATAHAGFNAFESLLLLLTAWTLQGPGT